MEPKQAPQPIRFDDIQALKARVGEPFAPYGGAVTVTQEMINRFADVTLDRQWIHIDEERARRESPFGGTIAHGFLVLSLIVQLRRRPDMEIVGYGNIVNYGADKLRFVSPVRAGQAVRARCRILAVEHKPKGTLVTEEVQVMPCDPESLQPQGDTPALSYTMLLLYQAAR